MWLRCGTAKLGLWTLLISIAVQAATPDANDLASPGLLRILRPASLSLARALSKRITFKFAKRPASQSKQPGHHRTPRQSGRRGLSWGENESHEVCSTPSSRMRATLLKKRSLSRSQLHHPGRTAITAMFHRCRSTREQGTNPHTRLNTTLNDDHCRMNC
jgi:hypothetical protein